MSQAVGLCHAHIHVGVQQHAEECIAECSYMMFASCIYVPEHSTKQR